MVSDVRVVRCGHADYRVAVGGCYVGGSHPTHALAAEVAHYHREAQTAPEPYCPNGCYYSCGCFGYDA